MFFLMFTTCVGALDHPLYPGFINFPHWAGDETWTNDAGQKTLDSNGTRYPTPILKDGTNPTATEDGTNPTASDGPRGVVESRNP